MIKILIGRRLRVDWFKLNVDAEVDTRWGVVGSGCVMRTGFGYFVVTRAITLQFPFRARGAEALSTREVLS